ncbi:uncharacterized protein B0J16DRAFT_413926 [Fusarium flagelliforme]|uniref:Uncharacterized protein n=1 Tax=Fusarium flagelliforme TaxID=2675880 RepID=A0A395MQC1_9HYPO|nr:uncharacterized protein B0J16DRAFT_413926 [Fusarium flagelliforme]KAH7189564.1 hypothetical protein B0J16DRAFT_413926 [Fusarium flagelliforme]RFN50131.1 hypothetical protein FIE12Z_5659 [Fusarium flagelliforme]
MDEMSEGLSHTATLKLRFKEAWRLLEAGDIDAAEAMAVELLLESRLSRYHKAGCHIILSTSSDNSFEHGIKTLCRYNDIWERTDLTEAEGNDIFRGFCDAMTLLDKARQDQASNDQQGKAKSDRGMAMEEPSQSVPEMTGESQLSSQRTVSLRTESNQTDNSADRDTIGMDLDFDENEPLSDIVRYKIGSGLKKDEDQV